MFLGDDDEPDPQMEATNDELVPSPKDWDEYTTEQKLTAPKGAIFETRLEVSEILRKIGNERFQSGDIPGALTAYRRAFWHIDFDLGYVQLEMTEFHQRQVFEAQAPCRLNIAQCLLKDDHTAAKHEAEAVLESFDTVEIDVKWKVKAMYWRAKAYVFAGRYDDAENDLLEAIALDSNDKLLRSALRDVKAQRSELKEQQRKLYDGKLGGPVPQPVEDQRRWCLIS